MRAETRLRASDVAHVRRELLDLAGSWRQVLVEDPGHARPIVSSLLAGRVMITPTAEPERWELRGQGTLAGLFTRSFPLGMASPPGSARFSLPEIRRSLRRAA